MPKHQHVATGGLIAVVGAAAAALLVSATPKHEGVVLKGYRDPVGIPTKCMGDTYDVVVGKTYSMAECRESMDRQLRLHAVGAIRCNPSLRAASPGEIAAHVDLAYNFGVGGYCKSSVAQQFKVGNRAEACRRLNRFVKGRVKGKLVPLPGLVKRRAEMSRLCLNGVNNAG
jgi:lysozyme